MGNNPSMRRLGLTPANTGHPGHFCVWVLDAITGQPGQTLTPRQIAYQTEMRNAVVEAYRIANEGEEEMTQEYFNKMMDIYLAERERLDARPGSTFDRFVEATNIGITDGARPQAFATRQEVAVMVHNAMNKFD